MLASSTVRFFQLVCFIAFVCFTLPAVNSIGQEEKQKEKNPDQPAEEKAEDKTEKDYWQHNVDEALKQSTTDKKPVFVLFTGSDWCPPCKKLEEEVFSTDVFAKKSGEMFHMVMLDFPRTKEQLKEQKEHCQAWSTKLAANSFPTVILLDSTGRPFGKTSGYREGGPEAYITHLGELQQVLAKRDEAFEKAKTAKDEAEKAKHLDEGLSVVPEEFVSEHYEDIVKQIVTLDAKDKLGLRTKYYAAQDKEARKMILAKVSMAARTLKGGRALQVIDEAIAEMSLPAMMRIEAMQHQLRILRKMNQTDKAALLLDQMVALEGVEPEIQNKLFVQKAYLLVSAGNLDGAIGLLDDQIGRRINNVDLFVAKGELLDRNGEHDAAIEAFDHALGAVGGDSELMAEILSLKTESLVSLDKLDEAISILDEFASAEAHPYYIRADALVQKAVLLRENDRDSAAELAEKQALELIKDPDEKNDLRKYIDQLRKIGN